MPPNDSLLRTSADELFDLVKKSGKISVEEAAKKLKMPVSTIQALADFLVEEKVFGIEYKFTTPFLYLYKEGMNEVKGKEKGFAFGLTTKEHFYEKAKGKNVPYDHIEGMWREYLQQNLVYIREEFLKKAKEKRIPEERIGGLWKKYLSYL